jgi:hypothetical protein
MPPRVGTQQPGPDAIRAGSAGNTSQPFYAASRFIPAYAYHRSSVGRNKQSVSGEQPPALIAARDRGRFNNPMKYVDFPAAAVLRPDACPTPSGPYHDKHDKTG